MTVPKQAALKKKTTQQSKPTPRECTLPID